MICPRDFYYFKTKILYLGLKGNIRIVMKMILGKQFLKSNMEVFAAAPKLTTQTRRFVAAVKFTARRV